MVSEIDLASKDNPQYREQLAKSRRIAAAIGAISPGEAFVGLVFEPEGAVLLATNIAAPDDIVAAVERWLDMAKKALRQRAS